MIDTNHVKKLKRLSIGKRKNNRHNFYYKMRLPINNIDDYNHIEIPIIIFYINNDEGNFFIQGENFLD